MIKSERKQTTIKLDSDVRKELGSVGLYGETLSDIIGRLVKEHKERHD